MTSRVQEILAELVAFPTVSSDSNLKMIGDLRERLEAVGARCFETRDSTGTKANLFASLGPDRPGGIMLSGHTDVVPVTDQNWSSDPFVMEQREDRLFGRGTCDMKGFIAAALDMALRIDAAAMTAPLHLAFTYDEEIGCLGAQALVPEMEERGIRPEIAIIGEPTEMRVIEGHKGCYEYTTRFSGLEGHGSAPDLGVNAAEYAARFIGKLLELREHLKTRAPEWSQFEPPWSTINIGRVSGGIAPNVIPGKAEVDWEMRPVHLPDADLVKERLARFVEAELLPEMRAVEPTAGITTEVLGEVAGLEPMERNAARDLVTKLTGSNTAGLVAFGTEAGIFQQLGTSVVVCGPGSIAQAHKPDEFIALDQLAACSAMLDRLAIRLTS